MYKPFLKIKTWAILMAALLILALAFQFVSTKIDAYRYPPPGKLVDMGGYKLHLYCTGSGPSTVILDAGSSSSSLEWSLVQPEVSKFTQVCSYDRAGFGWSEQSPNPRTSVNMVEELHTLLQKAQIKGPYILVGHSFGGSNMRIYTSKYPEDVKGVVLVDASHEDLFDKLKIPLQPKKLEILWEKAKIYLGYYRIAGYDTGDLTEFPRDIQKAYSSQAGCQNVLARVEEEKDFYLSLKQLKAHSNGLHDKPLIVVSAAQFHKGADEINKLWPMLQKDLLTKSKFSKQIIASKSDHGITRHQPDVIVEAIKMSL